MEFRIKKQEYVNRTFRITKELAERLSQVAQDQNCSVNELVVQSCEFALNHIGICDNDTE
jgi:predicted HicB family RNase H-like nuclease